MQSNMQSTILEILQEIGADTKRSHKLAIIKREKDNPLFKRALKFALNPYQQFYIRKIPTYTPVDAGAFMSLGWALDQLSALSNRTYTGNAGIEHLRTILQSLHNDDAIVIERIIGKDLRCGVADSTVNDVLKDYIPTYPCLLARPYDEKNIKNIVFPCYSNLKADGLRVNIHVNGTSIYFCGRSGRTIELYNQLDADFIELSKKFNGPQVFDGELIAVDEHNNLLSRKVSNGIVNKAIKGTITIEEAAMLRVQMWDVITEEEFIARKSNNVCKDRFDSLIHALQPDSTDDLLINRLKEVQSKIWLIPSIIVHSLDEAQKHFELMISEGMEGTILKNFNSIWEDKRSKHLVKMKAELDVDLEIIGFNPGQGKYEHQVGSLICASSDHKVEVAISGFSESLRLEITANIAQLMGKIIAIKYNERIGSKDRPDVDSLFLPRFECFRNDKTVANSSDEIPYKAISLK